MTNQSRSESRALLMRKLMTICPVCGKLIYGRDINLDKSKVRNWPVSYEHYHSHNGSPEHLLTLFIDANYSVRSFETVSSLKL